MNRVLSQKEVDNLLLDLSGDGYHYPCPFCNSMNVETTIINEYCSMYAVVCNNCNARGPIADSMEEAERKWNKRG